MEFQKYKEFLIRNLKLNELSDWFDFLSYEIFQNDSREIIEGMWNNDIEKNINGIFVALNNDQKIISSVKAESRNIKLCNNLIFAGIISGVGTKKEFRGQGINRHLFKILHNYLKDRGVSISHLYSKPDTFEYYKHLGYLNSKKHEDESFYRMFYVIQPFTINNVKITNTKELIDILDKEDKH